MATTKGITTIKNKNLTPANANNSLQGLLSSPDVKNRFEELLGKKAPGFISSILSVANNNKVLFKCEPKTVIAAAALAAALDLPVNQNLGFAYIIPFNNSKEGRYEAQFQLGYKGYIQLAMRSGQYQTINAAIVYEGEIVNRNRFTGEFEFGERTSDKIIGYIAYFKLVNGFEKYNYMTVEEMQSHAKKFSKNYKGGTDKWGITDFNRMALKTVLKLLISKYGILSIEMQGAGQMAQALSNDGGVIDMKDNGEFDADFDGETIDSEIDSAGQQDAADGYRVGDELVNPDTGEVIGNA